MIKKYHKTATILAEPFDGSPEMLNKYDILVASTISNTGYVVEPSLCYLKTLEGDMTIHVNDYIATGVNGEHWAIADDVFQKTYSELPVIPKGVEEYFKSVRDKEKDNEHIDAITVILGAIKHARLDLDTFRWITNNGDDFARAWLEGYQVERK